MATQIITMTGDWQLIATAPANVAFEPLQNNVEWLIDDDTLPRGHNVKNSQVISMQLEGSETLYVKGRGDLAVTIT